MSFAYPYLLPLPLLVLLLAIWRRHKVRPMLYPDLHVLREAPRSWRVRVRTPALGALWSLSAVLLGAAAARPQHVTVLPQAQERRNLMLTIDVSGSMRARDFKTALGRIGRLDAVKRVLAQFISARTEDRIGLVVFGTNAFLQSPLTTDHTLVSEMIQKLEVGMAGEDTAIGDGLGLSLKRIESIPGQSKAIVLLTDGVNRSGQVNPVKAAKVARDLGIIVHTVGIGSDEPVQSTMPGIFSLHQTGKVEFDEETLKRIAEITGGVYFNANSLEGLQEVYQAIDRLERSDREEPEQRVVAEYTGVCALAGAVLYLLLLMLSRSVLRKIP